MSDINQDENLSFLEKATRYLKKNGVSLLMGIALVTMIVNPDAKAWVLQKLLLTGFFNPKIEQKEVENYTPSTTDFSFINENNRLQVGS